MAIPAEAESPPLLAIFPAEGHGDSGVEACPTAADTLPEASAGQLEGGAQVQGEQAALVEGGAIGETTAPDAAAQQAQAGGPALLPPLALSLTRLPEELPPQLHADFEMDASLVGEGAYAAVRRVRHRQSGEMVALKVVEKYPLLIRNMLPQLQREVGLQGRLHHRNILRLLHYFEDETHVYMLLEYCAGGTLRTLASQTPGNRFPEAQAAWLFTQILYGVDFMHRNNVVHRDLKHDNILLTGQSEVRICDFGWSAEVQVEKALLTTCGTPHCWAPEIFEGQPQGYGTDLWALGNLVYELLVGHQPFWGTMEELRVKVLSVDLRYPPGLLSQAAINLFYCLLQRDQRCRIPCWRLIAEHPWILPAVAALVPCGLVPEPLPQVPAAHPRAHATVEPRGTLPADAPIAMLVDVSGPISFVPALPPQPASAPEGQATETAPPAAGLPPSPVRRGPQRSTQAASSAAIAPAADEVAASAPTELPLPADEVAALAENSDPSATSREACAPTPPAHQAEPQDAEAALQQQDGNAWRPQKACYAKESVDSEDPGLGGA